MHGKTGAGEDAADIAPEVFGEALSPCHGHAVARPASVASLPIRSGRSRLPSGHLEKPRPPAIGKIALS
jgi:hypothetical protein